MENQDNLVLSNVFGDVCIRKARRKRQKLLVRELMQDYAKNTTLHGLPYVTRPGLTVVEKTFWLLTFLVSVSLCLYSISRVWVKWRLSPVIVTVSEQQLPVSMVPFPSVTICPQSKCLVKKYNYTDEDQIIDKFLRSDLSDSINSTMQARIHKVAALKQICNEFIDFGNFFERYPYNYSDSTVFKSIREVAPTVSNVFLQCVFRGVDIRCKNLFKKVVTVEGICYNMNSLPADEILRLNQLQTDYAYLNATKSSMGWSMEEGYTKGISDIYSVYPYPGAENGKTPDLEVILQESVKNRDETCNALNSGYRVYVHHPTDLPQSSLYYYAILKDQVSSMALSLTSLTTSETLKRYDSELRQCYFPGEKYLKYFSHYTEKNCRLECLSNTTFSTCGCVKFYMPHESGVICTVKNEECVTKALKKIQFPETDIGNATCYCLPSCNSVEYEAEILKTEFKLRTVIENFYKRMNRNVSLENFIYSKLDMYFKKPRFLSMRRSEVFGMIDFFANCGGLLGLFLGFSVLSLIEIFYFLTLRLFYTLKKDLEEEKKQKEIKKVEPVEKY